MNMNVSTFKAKDTQGDPAQWQARVDLAAAHRLAVLHGLHEGIFNHFTLAVPNADDRYYQIPFGLHWSEVTASTFMEVSYDGTLIKGEGEVERSGYCIHAPMHRLSKEAACVLHTHMPFASALTRLKDQRILPIGQTELGVSMQTAYDDEYTGPGFDPAEGERLVGAIGDKSILLMANHGAVTIGRTVAAAYDRMYYLERVAQVQMYAMWTGQPLHVLSQDVIDKTIEQFKKSPTYYGRPNAEHHFDALKRMLDREQPDYTN
jgi:ribulose-5-phosphate 4-epimerase/fuculose-1-phosphate aldolase